MRMLIRIVFVIFIAKGIDCLGGICDDFCGCRDCLKIIYKLSITGEPFLPFTSNKLFKILNISKPKWNESLNNSVDLKILNTEIPFLFDKIEN